MVLALAWLTVSLPFVYADQQTQKAIVENQSDRAGEDNSLLTNTTEEKSENGVNTLSEYLHDTHLTEHVSCFIVRSYNLHSADLYIAFHPEYICPPPDAFAS